MLRQRGILLTYRQQTNRVDGELINLAVTHDDVITGAIDGYWVMEKELKGSEWGSTRFIEGIKELRENWHVIRAVVADLISSAGSIGCYKCTHLRHNAHDAASGPKYLSELGRLPSAGFTLGQPHGRMLNSLRSRLDHWFPCPCLLRGNLWPPQVGRSAGHRQPRPRKGSAPHALLRWTPPTQRSGPTPTPKHHSILFFVFPAPACSLALPSNHGAVHKGRQLQATAFARSHITQRFSISCSFDCSFEENSKVPSCHLTTS